MRQSLDTQLDNLKAAGVSRVFSEKISTRATTRPELDKAIDVVELSRRLVGSRLVRREECGPDIRTVRLASEPPVRTSRTRRSRR